MNTIKTNFHTHSQRCGHADGIEEDYIKSAISCGVSELGFSDHGPYPDFDFGLRMPFCELPKYLEALDALIPKYQKEITIKKGLEIEYYDKWLNGLFFCYLSNVFPCGEIRMVEEDLTSQIKRYYKNND